MNQGLQDQVVYRVWLVAEDSLGNVQTALSSVTVETVWTTPPTFEEIIIQYNAPTSVYVEVGFAELKLALDWHSVWLGREQCVRGIALLVWQQLVFCKLL